MRFLLFAALFFCALACTDLLITKGATQEGTNYISYAADSHQLYGDLAFREPATHPEGTMIDVVEWDTGKPLGKIPQAPRTYSVIGNMNEFQLAIGETTYGGREELKGTGIIDYGSLIWLALQRAMTAREAIDVIGGLLRDYGYASSGESFSIMDKDEVWVMEIIGKGKRDKGAVWAAMRIPDGCVSAHANQARITQLIFNDPSKCRFSTDVITFAREMGYFDGQDAEFSFSDTYSPVTPSSTRGCDTRVYSFFHRVLGEETMGKYYQYALGNIEYGQHGYATNRMPLYMPVPQDKKLSTRAIMNLMRDHFEELPITLLDTPGAGPFGIPYRWRPMDFKVNDVKYTNERAIATQQTAWHFIAQARTNPVDVIGGVFWFSVDDAAQSVYVPFYCGHNIVPEYYREGNGNIYTYSPTSMFWMTTRVAHHAYFRYADVIVDIKKAQDELEEGFIKDVKLTDAKAAEVFKSNGRQSTITYLTSVSNKFAEKAFTRYKQLEEFLLIKYMDGNIKYETDGKFVVDEYGIIKYPDMPALPQWTYDAIVEATGDLHRVPAVEPPHGVRTPRPKGL